MTTGVVWRSAPAAAWKADSGRLTFDEPMPANAFVDAASPRLAYAGIGPGVVSIWIQDGYETPSIAGPQLAGGALAYAWLWKGGGRTWRLEWRSGDLQEPWHLDAPEDMWAAMLAKPASEIALVRLSEWTDGDAWGHAFGAARVRFAERMTVRGLASVGVRARLAHRTTLRATVGAAAKMQRVTALSVVADDRTVQVGDVVTIVDARDRRRWTAYTVTGVATAGGVRRMTVEWLRGSALAMAAPAFVGYPLVLRYAAINFDSWPLHWDPDQEPILVEPGQSAVWSCRFWRGPVMVAKATATASMSSGGQGSWVVGATTAGVVATRDGRRLRVTYGGRTQQVVVQGP